MTDKLNHNPQPELSEHDAELLSAYIDEMLSDDEQRELEARLLQDAFLRNELRAMRQTVQWMNVLPTLKAPRNFTISAKDVAPVETVDEKRKLIPMQNRNYWYLASAAAVVIVLVGFLAVFPLTSNLAPASSDGAAESIAFSATEALPPATEIPAQTLDTAASEPDSDIALFETGGESNDDFAEEAAEEGEAELASTVNTQAAEGVDSSPATNVAFAAVIQETSTVFADTSARAVSPQAEQSANFAFSTATSVAIGQGGGNANNSGGADSPPVSADMMADDEMVVESDDADTDSLNVETSNLQAEDPIAPQDENQTSDVADNGASGATTNSVSTGIETRSSEPEISNLIQAVLRAMRQYAESQQP